MRECAESLYELRTAARLVPVVEYRDNILSNIHLISCGPGEEPGCLLLQKLLSMGAGSGAHGKYARDIARMPAFS